LSIASKTLFLGVDLLALALGFGLLVGTSSLLPSSRDRWCPDRFSDELDEDADEVEDEEDVDEEDEELAVGGLIGDGDEC
jgi:hypothetical protein